MTYRTLVEIEPPRQGSGDTPAAGPVYRASYSPKENPPLDGIKTLEENFRVSAEKYANRPCLGSRRTLPDGSVGPFEYLSYAEVKDIVAAVHAGYESLGLGPGDRIGAIGANAPEWMMAMQAMNRMNGVCVPLYETLGDNAVEYIMEHSGAKCVAAQASKLPVLAKALAKGGSKLAVANVIYWGQAGADAVQAVEATGVKVHSWEQLIERGRKSPVPARPSTPEDMCTIMYTSGTTGDPKGVMLSHNAVVTTIAAAQRFLAEANEKLGVDDVYLSYLPLAHILDRVVEEFMLHVGGSIGYWQGDIKKIMSDIEACKPTLFAGVPRVFERIYGGIQEQLAKGGFLKNMIFQYAYYRKLFWMKHGWRHDQASKLSDTVVFNKIKAKLGGSVRVILTGGAPISPHVEEFLKVTMCAPVVQGYGLTETGAASFISYPYDIQQTGTVGPPMPHTELRLEAVPEMGYDPFGSPPRGEVCIRGPGVFMGYYKNDTMTKEVLDSDGFVHTGDIGEITETGALKIIDRKKNLFKLSHGEYIAVERVENTYKGCSLVEQLWVYGNSFESCLVAVVVPKEEQLRQLAAAKGVEGAEGKPFEALLTDDKVIAAVISELRATGKAEKLKGFEDIKAVKLESELFSVENDLMTPSFKLRRPQLQKKYQKDIDAMYKKLKSVGAAH